VICIRHYTWPEFILSSNGKIFAWTYIEILLLYEYLNYQYNLNSAKDSNKQEVAALNNIANIAVTNKSGKEYCNWVQALSTCVVYDFTFLTDHVLLLQIEITFFVSFVITILCWRTVLTEMRNLKFITQSTYKSIVDKDKQKLMDTLSVPCITLHTSHQGIRNMYIFWEHWFCDSEVRYKY